jgi:hypothetical protein
MDIGVVNTESTDAIDTIDKMVKEFDIKVGFHNHPRRNDDPNYKVWDPNYILSLVKDRDVRIGACADTGHWVRSGIKPVDALRILRGRVVSSHLKDLHVFTSGGHDMPYGQGVSDIRGILDELRAQNFDGPLSVEYEYNWDNNVAEIAQCIGFVRGYGNVVMSGTQAPLRPGKPISLFNGRDFRRVDLRFQRSEREDGRCVECEGRRDCVQGHTLPVTSAPRTTTPTMFCACSGVSISRATAACCCAWLEPIKCGRAASKRSCRRGARRHLEH